MESTLDEANGEGNDDELDPRAQLSMLARVQNATEVEASTFGAQLLVVGGMWLLTAVGFAFGISVSNRLRDRWAVPPR